MTTFESHGVPSVHAPASKLTFRTRLRLASGMVLLALLVTGLVGMYVARQSVLALQDIYEKRTVPAVKLANILANSQHNYEVLLRLVNAAEAEKIEPSLQEYLKNKQTIEQDLKGYQEMELAIDEAALLKTFEERKTSYEREGLAPVFERIEAVKSSAIPRAEWSSAATLLLGKGTQEMEKMVDSIRQLIVKQAQGARQDYLSARNFQAQGIIVVASVFGASTLLVLVMGYAIARSLAASLGGNPEDVRDVALRISKGDLAFTLNTSAQTRNSLNGAMALVREELSAMVQRIREASAGLVTASSEISQNNANLSSRTEHQAADLQLTTAGVEELAILVQSSAESAKAARHQARSASEMAQQGGAVVAEVIATMKDIQTSSNKISEIINVIDGIAFQTNILALNAAVESARAGEQGRGFAVVANEVRSLAKRSATAAKEIKTLIQDSVEGVDAGTLLVDKAGATMTQVVQAIGGVSGIMTELNQATAEQEAKVSLVRDSILQMDASTQQNAALAEQMAAAALELNKLANEQFSAVAVFKIHGDLTPLSKSGKSLRIQ